MVPFGSAHSACGNTTVSWAPKISFSTVAPSVTKKNLKKVLTLERRLNTTEAGESQGPISRRDCERHRDTFAGPVFGRRFRVALSGGQKFLCRSGLARSTHRNAGPAMERAKRDSMERNQCCFGKWGCHHLFLGVESPRRHAAVAALVCSMQTNQLRTASTNAGWLRFLQFKRNHSELAGKSGQ
jgi:hypothetical protein